MNKHVLNRYKKVRNASLARVQNLEPEQCRSQPILEVSPPWWHLAHTSWFFVRNVLNPFGGKETKEDRLFDYILNSYYDSLGPQMARDRRGAMTRPTMKEVYAYRHSVDERMELLLQNLKPEKLEKCAPILEIGIQHEQQHQELFYTDIKCILFQNPIDLRQPLVKKQHSKTKKTLPSQFIEFKGGLFHFGNQGDEWGWDNEYPVHQFFLNDFALQNRLVTNGEYLAFMEAGGYKNPLLWLNNGWNQVIEKGWQAPLYWEKIEGDWFQWTLTGMKKVDPHEPVCHVSFYEAEAFATWKGLRLPSEREWEYAAREKNIQKTQGNFLDTGYYAPKHAPHQELGQMFGDVWEWTTSYFEPYPGYAPFAGCLCEYNEKFMDNQRVIRGGSCVSERDHLRITYRNFWPPDTRFQFTGIRLAKNLQ